MNSLREIWCLFRLTLCTIHYCLRNLWRRPSKHTTELINQSYLAWATDLLQLAKVRCQVHGWHADLLTDETTIIMCNHTSLMDIPLSVYAWHGQLRMVAKAELRRIPLFGHVMEKMGCVCLNRQQPEVALQQLAAASERAQSIPIWCAPEGTRGDGGDLLPLKKGMFRLAKTAQAQIIPMTIVGAQQVLPARSWKIRTQQKVHIHIGAPIAATQVAALRYPELMALVRQRMLAPLTEQPTEAT